MVFADLIDRESPEQEQTRLASAPAGSINHALSQLPVTIAEWPQDKLVELPWAAIKRFDGRIVVVVVPVAYSADATEHSPRRRFGGAWECVVVHSDHPAYPVGGHRLSIPAAEIARGREVFIEGTRPPF